MRRRADPYIAESLLTALGDARSVLNAGAGAGSYEPVDRFVVGLEPSDTMIGQRPNGSPACVQAIAEQLPFLDASFDAAMGVLTVHHWTRMNVGLSELRRVARKRIVLLTWDPECDERFWLTRDYLPEVLEFDRARFPKLSVLERCLGPLEVSPLMIPANCEDGFRSSYWKRPAAYLEPEVQRSISSFTALDAAVVERFTSRLADDLASGEWARRNAELEHCEVRDIGYRIVTAISFSRK